MALVINNNMMAATAARNLNNSYGNLSKSVNRLSSGLRINSAADDAAGLAIREMMRSDITSLNQGVRNANDAISLIQTADGALGVIDEKLIRMKELAEQASTGTYTSTQRLIIDSEYQAMASEITRIANATDFNGIKLLDGNLSSSQHSGAGKDATGKLKVHFGTGNDSAEDYYYLQIQDVTAKALGVGNSTNYKDMMASAKEDSLEMLAKNFGSMKTGDATAQAAYQRMEKATDDLFIELENRVSSIFDGAGAELNYNRLFEEVNLAAAIAKGTLEQTGGSAGSNATSAFAELEKDVNKTRIYGSKEELDEAAAALYESMANSAVFKGQTATTPEALVSATSSDFANTTLHASALQAVATLYDRAVIAAEGGSVPKAVKPGDFDKISDSQKDAMKANVSMAFLNTMTNGSAIGMSTDTGIGAAGTGTGTTTAWTGTASMFGKLNNISDTGTSVPAGQGLVVDKLENIQIKNIVGKLAAGYAQKVGTSTTAVADTEGMGIGPSQSNPANTDNSIMALLETNAAPTGGTGKALVTIGTTAAGGYIESNAITDIGTIFGAQKDPDPARNTGFTRAGMANGSLAQAFANGIGESGAYSAMFASLDGNNIQTQEAAQKALGALDKAILKKDNVRADLGAMQNRLENTITNLQVQAENLQAAESRISDVDVATEMTNFVKTQILTQTAVSMLAQANTMPQMAQKLIG